MYIQLVLLLFSPIIIAYEQSLTPWFCTKPNPLESTIETSQTLASCLPGYAIDIEDVVYESTTDGECSGKKLCSLHNKNTLTFACNTKSLCSLKIRQFRFHINSTCGSTVRFFLKYRCLPVIFEQKDYLCDSSSSIRRGYTSDINLSCEHYYRLYIKMALVGISIRRYEQVNKNTFKCNKDTYWSCNHYVLDAYKNVCSNQLNQGYGNQCQIKYNDRPRLKNCQYGESSNFSLVEYLCIPGDGIREDLSRIDICSNDQTNDISMNRGLLHSPHYPHSVGNYLSCKKQIHITRESHIRLFMHEKSLEYSHQLNIYLLNTEPNIIRTLSKNELFETNLTNEIIQIELKTTHVGGGNFLLYFQVDSRISEYAPLVLEADRKIDDYNRRKKSLVKRDWGIAIGSLIGLVLVLFVIAIVLLIVRITKRRRAQSLKYLKTDDDDHHLNTSTDHRLSPRKPIQIEHPHLLSSTAIGVNSHRPNSSTSIITTDGLSDRESLLKQSYNSNPISTNNENFYEEIKEHYQQQANLALGNNQDIDPYLEPQEFDDRKKFSEDKKPLQPIRDHRENEHGTRRAAPLATPEHIKRRLENVICDAPMASTETLDVTTNPSNSEQLKRPKQPPPKVPPPRMDLNHPKPSAPPLHLLENDRNDSNENIRLHQRLRNVHQRNNQNQNV